MDTGVFSSAPLNRLEFENESIGNVPLPDELPAPPDSFQIRSPGARSTAVESLLAQNEDLMARLKVALRRLNLVETENQKLSSELEDSRQRIQVAEDQTLILREKDQAWKDKSSEAQDKVDALQAQASELATLLRESQAEVARYKKYHDRIRTQVKPHLVELKGYASGLEEKVASLQADVERKESKIRDLREQIVEVTKNSRTQVEQSEIRVHEMIESYEATLSHQGAELDIARETIKDLDAKAQRLARAEQRSIELENTVVELRRARDEVAARQDTELRRLTERIESLASDNVRLRLENEDIKAKVMADYERIRELEKQNFDQQSQMESLRFLYNNRTEENERLKMSLTALERLNVDLSERIQELRGSSPSSAESTMG